MSSTARLAIAAAAVVAVALVGFNFVRSPSISGPGAVPSSATTTPNASASPSVSPSSPASPPAYRWPGSLAAGTYSTSFVWGPDFVFNFTVPDGWESRDINIVKGSRMSVQFYIVENLVADTCSPTLRTPPIGRSVDDLLNGLSTLVTFDAAPTPVTLGGRTGKYVTYTVGSNLGCPPGQVNLMKFPAMVCGEGCGGVGGQTKGLEFAKTPEHNRLWVLGVGRGHVVIDALWTDDATPVDLAELQAVVDSIRLDMPNATPPPEPSP